MFARSGYTLTPWPARWALRIQERIATLRAEEVLFMVRAFAKLGIIQRDETLVDDRRLAVVALGREQLLQVSEARAGTSRGRAHLMVVQIAISSALVLVAAQVLQQLVAYAAPEAARMPLRPHRVHRPPDDRASASSAGKSRTLPDHPLKGTSRIHLRSPRPLR